MRVGNLTRRILEHLMDATVDSFYLFVAIGESRYGDSRGKIERRARELRESGLSGPSRNELKRRRNNFYSYLYHLQKDGLIERRRGKWSVTNIGRGKYKTLLKRFPVRKYPKEADTGLKIIIFDIPEKEKRKREWLRDRLVELGFKMLQKSVWVGKIKLPQEFVEDLRDLNLIRHVEVLAVTKRGSLKQLGY